MYQFCMEHIGGRQFRHDFSNICNVANRWISSGRINSMFMNVEDDNNELHVILPPEFFDATIRHESYYCTIILSGFGASEFYSFADLYNWLERNYERMVEDNHLTASGVVVHNRRETHIYFSPTGTGLIPFFQYSQKNLTLVPWEREGF